MVTNARTILVIGGGAIAESAHIPAAIDLVGARRTIVAEPSSSRRNELAMLWQDISLIADYREALQECDAVIVATPPHLHAPIACDSLDAGCDVLCEKPLAIDEEDCHEMIGACSEHRVKLMTAYRLHFDRANLQAIELIRDGAIGTPRIFNSLFTMQVRDGNIRLQHALGGGTLYDIGIYCINAARYLFRAEPTEGFAYAANNGEKRFREVDEMTGALLRFPNERLAAFICSFGASDSAVYEVVGTRGILRVKQAYEHSEPMEMEITVDGHVQKRKFPKRDQFGPELVYFSDCILKNKEPEPSGAEGLIDVQIIRSLLKSTRLGMPVKLNSPVRTDRPSLRMEIRRSPVHAHRLVRARTHSSMSAVRPTRSSS